MEDVEINSMTAPTKTPQTPIHGSSTPKKVIIVEGSLEKPTATKPRPSPGILKKSHVSKDVSTGSSESTLEKPPPKPNPSIKSPPSRSQQKAQDPHGKQSHYPPEPDNRPFLTHISTTAVSPENAAGSRGAADGSTAGP